MSMVLIKALAAYLLLVLCSPIIMESNPSLLPTEIYSQNLRFDNTSGSNTTSGQVSTFINFINSASYYHHDQDKLQYVSDKMASIYANSSYGFSVIQMGSQINYSWSVYSDTEVYASVAPGADRLHLQNSYIFLKERIYSAGRVYFFSVGQKGSDLSENQENAINQAILSVETTSTCSCSGNSKNIRDLLLSNGVGKWNVFCSSQYTFYVAVYPRYGQYIYAKPKNCYYILYAQ